MLHRATKSTFFASLGTLVEWYDYFLFIMLFSYFQKIFLGSFSPYISSVILMALYIGTRVARLLGGVWLGKLADHYGRKSVFLLSSLMMTISCFVFGLLPLTWFSANALVVIFIGLRLLQGISQGGETPVGYVYVYEHAPAIKRFWYLCLSRSSIAIGCMCSTSILTILQTHLSPAQMLSYGWRIPYLIAGAVGLLVLWVRQYSTETPPFEQLQATKQKTVPENYWRLLKNNWAMIVVLVGLSIVPSGFAGFIDTSTIMLQKLFAYQLSDIYAQTALGTFVNILVLVLGGYIVSRYLSQQYARRMLLVLVGLLVANVFATLAFLHWVPHRTHYTYFTLTVMFWSVEAPYLTLVVEYILGQIPVAERSTVFSTAYNAQLIVASGVPLLFTLLQHRFGFGDLAWVTLAMFIIPFVVLAFYLATRRARQLALHVN